MLDQFGIRGKLLIQGLVTVVVALVLVVTVVSVALWELGRRQAQERLSQATQVVSRSLSARVSANAESASRIAEDKELIGKAGFLQDEGGKADIREMIVVERRNMTLALGRAMTAARASQAAVHGMDGKLLCGAADAGEGRLELWCPDDRKPGRFLRAWWASGRCPSPMIGAKLTRWCADGTIVKCGRRQH